MATVPALGTDVADGELLMRLSTPWAEFARHPVPDLCEVWGWEGDTSVLPFRWHELRQQHVAAAPDMPDMSREQFVDMYVNSRAFSPSDFFIITSRHAQPTAAPSRSLQLTLALGPAQLLRASDPAQLAQLS